MSNDTDCRAVPGPRREIAAAASSEALEELRRRTRRGYGLEMLGSFVEILIDFRRTSLARVSRTRVS